MRFKQRANQTRKEKQNNKNNILEKFTKWRPEANPFLREGDSSRDESVDI